MNCSYMKCPKCGGSLMSWHSGTESKALCSTWTAFDSATGGGCGWEGELIDTFGAHAAKQFAELGADAAYAAERLGISDPATADRKDLLRIAEGIDEIAQWIEARDPAAAGWKRSQP